MSERLPQSAGWVPSVESWGVYVHVPWCRRSCPYCGFFHHPAREVPWERFADALAIASAKLGEHFSESEPETLFFGGGSPSLLPAPLLGPLVKALAPGAAEITLEANPEDLSEAWLIAAREAGVHRLSLGVQSLGRAAKTLGRAAGARAAPAVMTALRDLGFPSWSADLIFAVPGQTLSDLRADLDAILAFDPPHLSLYGLTMEPGTAFARAEAAGKFQQVDESLWREMYDTVVETLAAHGLQRYEVSNFARAGHASKHNQLYWSDRPYLGIGPGAHGYTPDGRRYEVSRDIEAWLADPTLLTWELPDADDAAIDFVLSATRSARGLDLRHLRQRYSREIRASAFGRLGDLVALEDEVLRLTPLGYPLCDGVIAQLVEALRPIHSAPARDR